jgi:hypothetical protein
MNKFNDKIKELNTDPQSTIPSIEIKAVIKHRLISKIDQLQKSVLAVVPYSNKDNSPNKDVSQLENLGKQLDEQLVKKPEKKKYFNMPSISMPKTHFLPTVSRMFSRSLDAKTHIDNILRDLSVVNSFFIFYNSQFEWLIRQTEMIINNKYKDKNQNDEILFNIWSSIFKENTYTEYMGQQLNDTDNLKTVLDDLGKDFETQLDVRAEKAIVEVVEEKKLTDNSIQNGNQDNGNQDNGNGDGGGKKTKKRHPRKIRKPKRKYTHRKMFIKNTFIPVKI